MRQNLQTNENTSKIGIVEFLMRSGNVIDVECQNIKVKYDQLGQLTNYEIEGTADGSNHILCLSISDVEAVTYHTL